MHAMPFACMAQNRGTGLFDADVLCVVHPHACQILAAFASGSACCVCADAALHSRILTSDMLETLQMRVSSS